MVEDESKVSSAVAHVLKKSQIQVDVAADGEEGLIMAESGIYDVLVLDIMLPGLSGLEILQTIRKKGDVTPVLLLTARDSIKDRVKGLDCGADDYLVKPFALPELLARIKALSRRQQLIFIDNNLRIGNIELIADRLLMQVEDQEIKLSFKEAQVMEMFMRNPGRVFTREYIMERIWGFNNYVQDNNVEIYIHYLRKKMGQKATASIVTVRGVGYMLKEKENAGQTTQQPGSFQ
jgi:DNA-binding response OmpR family regulator